jgi:uncharacterized CHY-type Zn-finger protein
MSCVLGCPLCSKSVTVADEHIGVVLACPYCARHFTLPAKDVQAVPVAMGPAQATALTTGSRFTFTCGRCESILEARPELCGQPGRCPTCGALFVVPNVDPATGQAAGPAMVADDGQLPTPLHAYATAGDRAPTIRRLDTGAQVVVCPRCRAEMPVEADVCSACGIPFTMEGAASITQAPLETDSLARAAMTVGIIGVLTACQPVVGLVALGLGIAAMVKSRRRKYNKSGEKMAIAGIICGAAGAAIGVVAWILWW